MKIAGWILIVIGLMALPPHFIRGRIDESILVVLLLVVVGSLLVSVGNHRNKKAAESRDEKSRPQKTERTELSVSSNKPELQDKEQSELAFSPVKMSLEKKSHKKSIGKTILSILVGILILGTGVNVVKHCARGETTDLERQISQANRLCPVDIAGVGKMVKIALEENTVVYYLEYNNQEHDIDWLRSNPNEAKKYIVLSQFIMNGQNGNGDKLMDLIRRNHVGLALDISSMATGSEHFRITASPNEVAAYCDQAKLQPAEAALEVIKMDLQRARRNLPTEMDEGLVCTNVEVEDGNIIFKISADESCIDLNGMIEDSKDSIEYNLAKEEFFNLLNSSPATKALLNLCKIGRVGITYEFIGDSSYKKCDVIIDSDYISTHINTPVGLHIY